MDNSSRRTPWALLGLVCLLPAIQTLVAVHLQWYPVITYPGLKLLMIAVPIVVWWRLGLSARQAADRAGWRRPNLLRGLAVGALMSGVILAGYYGVLRDRLDPEPILRKVESLGLLEAYWAMALVISLWNSLFEEYYWRAFIVGELRARALSTLAACAIAGGLFGLHHIFALASLFTWPLVCFFTFGTMVAGGVWSWMRCRGYSIWDCYVSHLLADLAIMWIGYDLILRAQ